MTDYNKLTVVNLRGLLKERGIASTGLTKKAQLVERLEDADREKTAEDPEDVDSAEPVVVADAEAVAVEDAPKPDVDMGKKDQTSVASHVADVDQQSVESPNTNEQDEHEKSSITEGANANDEAIENLSPEAIPKDDPSVLTTVSQTPVPSTEKAEDKGVASIDAHAPQASQVSVSDSTRTDDVVEDNKKRKRRSLTPPVDEKEVAAKKQRQDDRDGVAHFEEDIVMTEAANGSVKPVQEAEQDPSRGEDGDTRQEKTHSPSATASHAKDEDSKQARREPDSPSRPRPRERESRYKKELVRDAPVVSNQIAHDVKDDDERDVDPAVHPATKAIYIRDLKRPLHPNQLKSHLLALAGSPGDDTVIETFFLDSIKTHAFAQFTNVSAASRVRSALHGHVYPDEKGRAPVWVDFIPEEKLSQWIEVEQADSGKGMQRWEVVYEDTNKGVEAYLMEADSARVSRPSRPGPASEKFAREVYDSSPHLRRGAEVDVPKAVAPKPPKELGQRFLSLDKLFESTAFKPKLYYLPVTKELAEKRLAELGRQTHRDWTGRESIDHNNLDRYSFEDGDLLISRGAHNPPGSGGRGGKGGRGGRGGYGSYRPGPY